ncbi:exopolyphosphatase-like protein [Xylariaceae sp. FL1651]|nr:exopolyphosphatase-like protein [Xylariaceae sp. FL1651]
MPPRASLKTFLATARAALTAPPSKRPTPLTLVVGNEAADLDSLCSALLLAYFRTYAPPAGRVATGAGSSEISSGTGSRNASAGTLHIPVCHLYRADLALRPEFAAVLRDADVKGEDVFTLEDVLPPPPPPPHDTDNSVAGGRESTDRVEEEGVKKGEILHPEDTRWLLVDHNAMTGQLGKIFGSHVAGCVDHHADEDAVPRDAEIRVIEKSGSCASLVVEQCAEIWDALSTVDDTPPPQGESRSESKSETAKIDAQLARLALGPVLIDTSNLGDRNKTTAHDERAVAVAESRIARYAEGSGGGAGSEEKYDRDAFFARLAALKEDLSDMTFRDVFRKDYKEWSVDGLHLGTSSVPQGFGYLVDQKAGGDSDAFVEELGKWGSEKDSFGKEGEKIDLVVVLTGFKDKDGQFRRELLVWARTEIGVKAARAFESAHKENLKLGTWGDGKLDLDGKRDGKGKGESEWRRCWTQRAVEHSRKQIAPMLRDALEGVAGG